MAPGFRRPNCCQLLLCRDSSDFSRARERRGPEQLDLGIEEDEVRRQHADDLERLAAQPKVLPNRIVAAAKRPLPEAVSQDDDLFLPELGLLLR